MAKIDVSECPTATIQGLGYLHKSFLIFSPESGITEQSMSNTRTSIKGDEPQGDAPWIHVENPEQELEAISEKKDELFPGTDDPKGVDSRTDRAIELLDLFRMLVDKNWKIDQETIDYNSEHQLYPLSHAEDFKSILNKLKSWTSKGGTDEVAEALAGLTERPNQRGANLEYFFKKKQ